MCIRDSAGSDQSDFFAPLNCERDILESRDRLLLLALMFGVVANVLELARDRLDRRDGLWFFDNAKPHRHRQRFLHAHDGRREEIELMFDVPDVPERGGELTAPGYEKPQGAERHVADPHGSHAIGDQTEKHRVRNDVAEGGLLDKPEPELAVRLNRLIEEPLDFLSFDLFLRVGLHAFDALPTLHAIAIEEPPHFVDRQADAKYLLVQIKRPRQVAAENHHDDAADNPSSCVEGEDPQRAEREDDVQQCFKALEQQHPLEAENTVVSFLHVGLIEKVVFADVHTQRLFEKQFGGAHVELPHVFAGQIFAREALTITHDLS